MHDSATRKLTKLASLVVLVLGVMLTAVMIYKESEPGALPLALILLGAVGYGMARLSSRSRPNSDTH
jgi:VIT1/CCC1 family predicted Fe2+/Mn2+ transporter